MSPPLQRFHHETRFSSSSTPSTLPAFSTVSPSMADQMDLSADEDDHHPEKHSYSCKRCRRLKKKCSRTKPECQNCNKSGENCEYVPRAPRRKKAEILKSMDYEGRDPVPQQSLPSMNINPSNGNQLPSVSEITTSSTSFTASRRSTSVFSTFDQQRPSLPPLRSLGNTLTSGRPYLPPTSQPGQGSSHTHSHSNRARLPMFNLQQAYLSNALHAPASGFALAQNASPLSHDLMSRCVDRFFEDYGKTYPFLDHAQFCDKYNPLILAFQNGKNFEVNMAVFLGYLSLTKMRLVPEDIQLKETLRVRALGDVSQFIQDESVETLKRLMYYAMYTLMEHSPDASWYVGGMITRMALSMGINRITPKTSYADEITRSEQEDLHRVFWSCYSFDRIISFSLGRPASLNDSDIDVPFLKTRVGENPDIVELFNALVTLRTVEGKIMREVHSPGAATSEKGQAITAEEQHAILQKLRLEVETWYNATSVITDRQTSSSSCSTSSWYSATYYNLLSMLYRPSFLIPSPSKETLTLLSRCSLQTASFIYNIHTHNALPMHWVQLNRLITHCTTLVYCLTHSCSDLLETKAEVNLCIELLEYFSSEWPVCAQVLDVFRKINAKVYDLRLKPELMANAGNNVGSLFKAIGVEYCDVLVRNGYEVKFDEPAIQGIRSI